MELQRLILEFKAEEIVVRCLYRSKGDANPGTVCRRREVTELARGGLTRALKALEGGVEVVGTSGYQVREDTISAEGAVCR